MEAKKIENPKTEVKEGIAMNDKDYLGCVLSLEKNMSNNYAIAVDEASNACLYEDIFTLLEDTKDAARECYDLSFRLGWYSLEEAEQQKVDEQIEKLEKQLQSLEKED